MKQPKENLVTLGARIPKFLKEKVQQDATKNRRTLSQQIWVILEQYYENNKQKKAA